MREYITAVAAVAVMAAAADVLIPKSWQKYISILTGAIILITLTSPLLKLRGISPPTLSLPEGEYTEFSPADEVQSELCERVENDISARIESEFGIKTSASVKFGISEGKIIGVKEILLRTKENSAITARLQEVYGCNNIIWEDGRN